MHFRKIKKIIIFSIFGLFTLSCGNSILHSETRVITVAAFGDEEFRNSSAWSLFIESHMRDISKFYDSLYGIQLKLTSINEWKSPDNASELIELLDDLKRFSAPCTTDIVLGFSLQAPSRLEKQNKVDFNIGMATLFGSELVVRFSISEIKNDAYVRRTLIHEIAHLFGAFHSEDTTTIMKAYSDGPLPRLVFDEQTFQMIQLLKLFPFCVGILCLDTTAHRLVSNIFEEGHFRGEQNPIASALQEKAMDYLERKDYDSASIMFQFALPHYDVSTSKSLSDYSVALMWVAKRDSTISLDSAIVVAEKATKLDSKNSKAFSNLGRFYLINFEPDRAIESFAQALQIDSLFFNAVYGMALTYLNLKDTSQTMFYLRKASKLNSGHEDVKFLLDSLKQSK